MQFIDLKAQQNQLLDDGRSLREVIDARMAAVLDHGQYILGPEVAELEQKLAA
jgi:UDP-2-acetamido-2-deoxy-ribo-hexuluronate aminotransferase